MARPGDESIPDSETGPPGVGGARAWLMIILIFLVQHRSGARAASKELRRKERFPLTDPEVVEPLAHGTTLVRDLIEVLVKTRLERDKPRQGREVVFWETRARSVQAQTQTPALNFIEKSSQGSTTSTNTPRPNAGWL